MVGGSSGVANRWFSGMGQERVVGVVVVELVVLGIVVVVVVDVEVVVLGIVVVVVVDVEVVEVVEEVEGVAVVVVVGGGGGGGRANWAKPGCG
jgi:hypothetical protein